MGAVVHADHLSDPLTRQAAPHLLSTVQTPPPVFALAKPFTKTALRETLCRASAAWPDAPRP
jgi:hypothetical protein